MLPRKISLLTYLVFAIVLCSFIVSGVLAVTNRTLISSMLFESQDKNFSALTNAAREAIELQFRNVEESINDNVRLFSDKDFRERGRAEKLIKDTLELHPTIFASEIIFTPDHNKDSAFKAIYGWRENDSLKIEDRPDLNVDFQSEWFLLPMKEKKSTWCEPYVDLQSKTLMITYSAPYFNSKGEIEAIITADISLEWIENMLNHLPLGKTGEAILFSQTQAFLFHAYNSGNSALSDAERNRINADKLLFDTLVPLFDMKSTGSVHFTRPDNDKDAWCYYQILPRHHLTIGCIIPEDQVFKQVHQLNRWTPGFALLAIVLLLVPSWWIARSVAAPLSRLGTAAGEVANGSFDVPLPQHQANWEINSLIESFDFMRKRLRHYIDEITESTRSNERLASEMNVAKQIQIGMLPKDFDSVRKLGIDLFTSMDTAHEVGGDLYDFAMIDEENFYFSIGDVSGKGIPASLFMAVGKTLFRTTILAIKNPAEALKKVNNELMDYNEASLFITVFCGILNIRTGQLTFSSAGHTPPIFIRTGEKPEFLKLVPDFPLGITRETDYKNSEIYLDPDTFCFLYTDGATDAANSSEELFGEERLINSLAECDCCKAVDYMEKVRADIKEFVGDAQQSDDITIVLFKYKPKCICD
ncbi:MAG: SpoIIE family protein phosphatase [Planctomycetia bacterium]|nr:SpoIIE family protein phosphatase [Planctomycetia bacterium]